MVEADSHLKLLPTSILDIYNVFEHIGMLPIVKEWQPYTVIPTPLGSDFGGFSPGGINSLQLKTTHSFAVIHKTRRPKQNYVLHS